MNKDRVDEAFEDHVREQIIHTAENTTAAQRLTWVQEMLLLFDRNGIDVHGDEIKRLVAERRAIYGSNGGEP